MESKKSRLRDEESAPDSAGDRGAGSVGERPELAGSRDKGGRGSETAIETRKHNVEDEIAGESGNEKGLGE